MYTQTRSLNTLPFFSDGVPEKKVHAVKKCLSSYTYSFNGKETDAESDLQDYGMRIYNPRLGKFLSVDPLSRSYPELTPYQFASNTPVQAIDLDGLEGALKSAGLGVQAKPVSKMTSATPTPPKVNSVPPFISNRKVDMPPSTIANKSTPGTGSANQPAATPPVVPAAITSRQVETPVTETVQVAIGPTDHQGATVANTASPPSITPTAPQGVTGPAGNQGPVPEVNYYPEWLYQLDNPTGISSDQGGYMLTSSNAGNTRGFYTGDPSGTLDVSGIEAVAGSRSSKDGPFYPSPSRKLGSNWTNSGKNASKILKEFGTEGGKNNSENKSRYGDSVFNTWVDGTGKTALIVDPQTLQGRKADKKDSVYFSK